MTVKVIEITGETSKYDRAMKHLESSTKKSTGVITNAWLKAAGAVYTLIKAWDMAKTSARAQQEAKSFSALAASYGQNSNKIVEDLKKASNQTIDTMTIIEKAGTAMMMGIAPEKLSKLMEIARATSRMTGQTVTKAFEDISLAVGRQSKMILDNLGIIVRVEDANKKYALGIGKTVLQLTDAEKKQAFLNATLAAGEDLMARMGKQGTTTAEAFQQIEAVAKNLKVAIGTMLLPFLKQMAEYLMNAANYWSKMFSTDALTRLEKQREKILSEMMHVERIIALSNLPPEVKAAQQKRFADLEAQNRTVTKSIQGYGKVPFETLPPITGTGGGGAALTGGGAKAPYTPTRRYGTSFTREPYDIGGPPPDPWARSMGIPTVSPHEMPFSGVDQAADNYRSLVEGARGSFSIMQTLAENTARNMQDAFGTFFFDVMQGKLKTLGDYVQSFVGAVQQSIASAMAGKLVNSMISGLPSLSFLKIHGGGVVGSQAMPTIRAPAMLLAGAPRLHKGLMPDEFPAILQRGETVLPRGSGAGSVVNIIMENPVFQDLNTQKAYMEQIAAVVAAKVAPGAVIRSYQSDGPVRGLIRSAR